MPDIKFRAKDSNFRIGEEVGRLWRGDVLIPVRPKLWHLLKYLAQRPRTQVPKDELLQAVWGDVNVGPESIDQALSQLRGLLGDDANDPQFIRVIAKKGLVFVAEIEPTPTGASGSGPLADNDHPKGADRKVAPETDTPKNRSSTIRGLVEFLWFYRQPGVWFNTMGSSAAYCETCKMPWVVSQDPWLDASWYHKKCGQWSGMLLLKFHPCYHSVDLDEFAEELAAVFTNEEYVSDLLKRIYDTGHKEDEEFKQYVWNRYKSSSAAPAAG